MINAAVTETKCGAQSMSRVKISQHSGSSQTGEVHDHNSSLSKDESSDSSDDNVPVVPQSGQSSTSGDRTRKWAAVDCMDRKRDKRVSSESGSKRATPRTSQWNDAQLRPWGFKELCGHVDTFSGKTGEEDFDVWLEDFVETTNDMGWSDQQRAYWFSWFITGLAKSTWQRTLMASDKACCTSIVSIYKGQYGVHMDPRTAYQCCHEFQYSQFRSVQGLVNAMRDYQQMPPRKLTDQVLESIMWNTVPVKLQLEVKELIDGSVQELLHKLLKAESVVEV